MQPKKNNAWTSPTLYFSSQKRPHWVTVELPSPPVQAHEPGSSPQTVFSPGSHPCPRQLYSGSRSAKIMTIVWNASSAHARLVSTKWRSCHGPNSPQYLCSMSSTRSFSCSAGGCFGGDRRGDRRDSPLPGSEDDVDIPMFINFALYIFLL